ncbi:MAG: hypothetical protein ABI570_03850 [Ilumatobacteraceae bacterium]
MHLIESGLTAASARERCQISWFLFKIDDQRINILPSTASRASDGGRFVDLFFLPVLAQAQVDRRSIRSLKVRMAVRTLDADISGR